MGRIPEDELMKWMFEVQDVLSGLVYDVAARVVSVPKGEMKAVRGSASRAAVILDGIEYSVYHDSPGFDASSGAGIERIDRVEGIDENAVKDPSDEIVGRIADDVVRDIADHSDKGDPR